MDNPNELTEDQRREKLNHMIKDALIVSILFERGYPHDERFRNSLSAEQQKEYDRLVALWKHWIPDYYALDDDPEDFLEQAYRLDRAIAVFGEENVYITNGFRDPKGEVEDFMKVDRNLINDERRYYMVHGAKVYGMVPDSSLMSSPDILEVISLYKDSNPMLDPRAERYYDFFGKKFYGRDTALVGFACEDPYHDVSEYLWKQYLSGKRKFVAKGAKAKTFLKTLKFKDGLNKEELTNQAEMALYLDVAHLEGRPDTIFIQDWRKLEYEYRFFVGDSELLSGAGRVLEHTPLNSTQQFNTIVRRQSEYYAKDEWDAEVAKDNGLQDKPELVDQYINFAQYAVDMLGMMKDTPSWYVLDVAWDTEAETPVVVEMNGIPNAGFYANDPKYQLEKLKEEFDRKR